MFRGYFALGGNEIGNNSRSYSYTRTAGCPIPVLKNPDAPGVADALGVPAYDYAQITDAPWYDPDIPEESADFFGAYVVMMEGLNDDTSTAVVTQKNGPGASIGGMRESSREIRVQVWLTAANQHALDYGETWLKAALRPGACGAHGTACGTTDFEFFSDLPPARDPLDDGTAYVESVQKYRRFLHDVARVSGPFTVEEWESTTNTYVGRLVEFTLVAEVPWVFGVTTEVEVPPTVPTIMQDIVYNRSKYPSANLTTDSRGLSPNPDLATDLTGWSASIAPLTGTNPAPYFTWQRVAYGSGFALQGKILGVLTGSQLSGEARTLIYTDIDINAVAVGTPVGIKSFGRFTHVSGENAAAHRMHGYARWINESFSQIGTDIEMGLTTTFETLYAGRSFAGTSVRPSGATRLRIMIDFDATWNTGPAGDPADVQMIMTGGDAGTGTVVATNENTNPSLETNATGWTASVAAASGSAPASFFSSGRVTGELASAGTGSYRAQILGNGSGTASGIANITVQKDVNFVEPAAARRSITCWVAALSLGGLTGANINTITVVAEWRNSTSVLRTDLVGTASGSVAGAGQAYAIDSLKPPAGADRVRIVVTVNVNWSSSATPASNSDIRVYVDALAVTVP